MKEKSIFDNVKIMSHEEHMSNHGRKTAKYFCKIRLQRGRSAVQMGDCQIIAKLAEEADKSTNKEEVQIKIATAVGYANAMQKHGLIADEELVSMITMLAAVGEDRVKDLSRNERLNAFGWIRRKVQA